MKKVVLSFALGAALLLVSSEAHALAIRTNSGFTTSSLVREDDNSTGLVGIGFNVDFYGVNYSSLYVNNNGNVTFDQPMETYTPFNIITTGRPMLAPFFADIDTRPVDFGITQYGNDTVDGHNAFGVNWINVGYFANHTDKLNSLQLVMIDRSDINPGDFDFEFNYNQIQWETGDASQGVNGLGGSSARAGYSNGVNASYEFPGSAVDGALLDNGPNSLIRGSFNSNEPGRYVFQVRNGQVIDNTAVPEPVSAGLAAVSLLALAATATRRR